MASITLSPDVRFPAGTTLHVYRAVGGSLIPASASLTNATVASNSTVTFTGLEDNGRFIAGPSVNGPFAAFQTPPVVDEEEGGGAQIAMVETDAGYNPAQAGRPWFGWTDPTEQMGEYDVYYAIPEPD